MKNKAFTLLELLVVIAIIAILAAILFPIGKAAIAAAHKSTCMQNLMQIAKSIKIYGNDYDDVYVPHRQTCGGTPANNYEGASLCPDYASSSGSGIVLDAPDPLPNSTSRSNFAVYFVYLLYKRYGTAPALFHDPDNSDPFWPATTPSPHMFTYTRGAREGNNYGGENSYGMNNFWLTPAQTALGGPGSTNIDVPISDDVVPRPSSTVMLACSTFYSVGPNVSSAKTIMENCSPNGAGTPCDLEGEYMIHQDLWATYMWANIGNGNFTYKGDQINDVSKSRHVGQENIVRTDTSAKSVPHVDLVNNVCYWTTDAEGSHPNCN